MLGEHHWHDFINGKIKRQRERERRKKRERFLGNSFQAELAYAVRWMM